MDASSILRNGSVFRHDGAIYYSPNSQREVRVPPQVDVNSYPFRQTANLSDFTEPRWWTGPYGWTSFIPTQPSFTGVPFERLGGLPRIDKVYTLKDPVYSLLKTTTGRWNRLARNLNYACIYLGWAVSEPHLRPSPPWLFGYQREYKTHSLARKRIMKSRDWFVMWMGYISYLIACISYNRDENAWFRLLAEHDAPQWWLAGIQASVCCAFTPFTPRAGVFLDILQTDINGQPRVEWFVHYGIPVWYRWSESLARFVAYNPGLAHLVPPKELLAMLDLPREITPPSLSPHPYPQPQPQGLKENDLKEIFKWTPDKPWVIFLEKRAAMNKLTELNETYKECERRMNRERDRPIKSSTMFVWEYVGDYTNPNEWIRTRVAKKEQEDVFDSYSYSQRVYDSFSNTWDLCEGFGPDSDSDASSDSDSDSGDLPRDSFDNDFVTLDGGLSNIGLVNGKDVFSNTRQYQRTPSPPPVITEKTDVDKPFTCQDLRNVLLYNYGFLDSTAEVSMPPSDTQWLQTIKSLGYLETPLNLPTAFKAAVVQFVDHFTNGQSPQANLWDLHDDNNSYIGKIPAVQAIVRTKVDKTELFIVPTTSSPSCTYKLAATNAAHALYICRIAEKMSLDTKGLTVHLANNGIPFHTLQPLRSGPISSQLNNIHRPIPIRLSGYKFSYRDYDAYVKERAAILSTPRGRAALLQGGLVWRLAVEHLSIDTLAGPSSAVLVHRAGFHVSDPRSGEELWDDKLTEAEISLICGHYICYTGNGDQTANISWWPLPNNWHNISSGMNWGRWTDANEAWYCNRLKDIEGGALPMASNKWRDKLRINKQSRIFIGNNMRKAAQFLESVIGQPA